MLALLLSFLCLAVNSGSATATMQDLVYANGDSNTVHYVRVDTDSTSRQKANARILGIPIQRVANITTITTLNIGSSSNSDGNIMTSGSKLHYSSARPVTHLGHTNDDPKVSGDGDDKDNEAPIPEYDDPGYRVKCLSPDDPADPDDERLQHEDFTKAFECWFYHRTRCFSGYLTSLDPTCKHDCSCDHSTWAAYNASTKGNHGAGLAGVCIVLPVPEYSPEDGGCLG